MAKNQKKTFKGIEASQEIDPVKQIRDIRPMGAKIKDWFKLPANVVMFIGMLAASVIWYKWLNMFPVLVALFIFIKAISQEEWAAVKMPIQAKTSDPNQLNMATGFGGAKAQGIFFLGNEFATGKEVWLTNSDCRQHFLVLGTTGAGKALPLSSIVMTSQGKKKVEDLVCGDSLITPDGKISNIVGYYPQGEKEIFELTLETGQKIRACKEHLWKLYTKDRINSSNLPYEEKVQNTQDIINMINSNRNVYLPLSMAVEHPESLFTLETEKYFSKDIIEDYTLSSISQRINFLDYILEKASVRFASITLSDIDKKRMENIRNVIWSLGGHAQLLELEENILLIHGSFIKKYFPNRIGLINAFENVQKTAGIYSLNSYKNSYVKVSDITKIGVEKSACIMLGNEDHLFVADDYVVTHNTEALLGFAANALSWGSGFLFCDGKGDVSLFAKVYAMCRRFGREDDLLVLNFMTGNSDIAGNTDIKSNTLNPFATGSSDGLTQMVVSLMDDAGGDGAMWKGRATAMLTGVMRALCWLRGNGYIDLNVGEIREYMQLKKIVELGDEKNYPDMPADIRVSIRSYLTSLPGYQEEKGAKQAQTTLDQHGYLEMQFTKILGSLADVYGHIFKTPYGEVDMYDVVLNRRILVIMLPALEKSGDEIANLGKIVVATLKGMMGATLGSTLDGTWQEVVDNRPTNSPSPFLCILDEVGYYTVEGMALMAAQARSLGFGMVYASQDIPAMEKRNEKEAASIIANTNTKIFMRLEEPGKTGRLAIDRAGKAIRSKTSGYERESSEFFGSHYKDQKGSSFEEIDRVHLTDLTQQSEGEMHIFVQGKVIRAKSFYADAPGSINVQKLNLGANHFIQVAKPSRKDLEDNQKIPQIVERIINPDFMKNMKAKNNDARKNVEDGLEPTLSPIISTMRKLQKNKRREMTEVTGGTIAYYHERLTESVNGFNADISRKFNENHSLRNNTFEEDGDPIATSRSMREREQHMRRQKELSKVNHGVRFDDNDDDDDMIDMTNNDLIKNRNIMKTMAEIDFDDTDDIEKDTIDQNINDILHVDSQKIHDDDDDDDDDSIIRGLVSSIHNQTNSVEENIGISMKGETLEDEDEDEDEDGGSEKGHISEDDEENDEELDKFLADLLNDDE